MDLAYVGEVVTNLEGFESVVGQAGVSTQDAYETGDIRFGLEGEPGADRCSSTTCGTSAR